MKRKLIAILAAVTLLCSVFVGMTFSASAEGERGFGMSKSEWKDFYGQAKEYDDGIGIGADANLQLPLYGETISLAMQFSIVPDTDFWYVLAFANNADFSAGSVHTGPNTGCFVIMMQPGADSMNFTSFIGKKRTARSRERISRSARCPSRADCRRAFPLRWISRCSGKIRA